MTIGMRRTEATHRLAGTGSVKISVFVGNLGALAGSGLVFLVYWDALVW